MSLFAFIEPAQWYVLPAAFGLDLLVGDPRFLPHPVRWMGRAIEACEPRFRRLFENELLAGTLFAAFMIAGCWGLTALVTQMAHRMNPVLGSGLETVLIFYCLSARSLSAAAMQIHRLLKRGRVDAARRELSMIVGRDVDRYRADDIARAAVETVAENFVDGVLSPLFFAVLGGAPLAMAYKMVNTLDSMVGYDNPRYRLFGRAAARMDDAANFIPARLSVLIIALTAWLLSGSKGAGRAMGTAWREGAHHSSPNAGYPEAAFAGALAVKLNGPNYYGGILIDKPYIGFNFEAVRPSDIPKTCGLMLGATLIAAVLAWMAILLMTI
ncbi:MAG: adenosylcobinamide-phosphate synthase CbiB [Desulfobacteraceae bacterium]